LRDILVYLQPLGGGLHPGAAELSAVAAELARGRGVKTCGVCLAPDLTPTLREALCACRLDAIDIYTGVSYAQFVAECFCEPLLDCVVRREPDTVLFGATLEGRALAPMLAARLETGVTADCTVLELDENGLLIQTRPAFGGNVMAEIITPKARPQIATLRQGQTLHRRQKTGDRGQEPVLHIRENFRPAEACQTRVLRPAESLENGTAAWEELIFAIGGGLRAKVDIQLFQTLCAQTGAALYCSRSLVERGWLPPSQQIGLSGNSVAPKLLVTFGISGSLQFLAGIRQAESLIAVNQDAEAPILKLADLPLVGDLYAVAAAMMQADNR